MSNRFDAGVIRIAVEAAGGRVVASTVHSDRPRGLAAALARHPAAAIPEAARRLFALCGTSHWVAATHALALAGAAIAVPSTDTTVRQLAAERITAHLQATFMSWGAAVPPTALEASALSCALIEVKRAAIDGDALLGALTELGISPRRSADSSAGSCTGSWAERLLSIASSCGGGQGVSDVLTEADDDGILATLDDQGDGFAAAPLLIGRRPETGPAARAARRGINVASPGDRLRARLNEIAEAAHVMTCAQQPDPAEWGSAGRLGPGLGFCAVETPRGRLYHLVRLGRDDTVKRYLILAPTEWNFAADGPFSAALNRLRIGEEAARPAIERLASLYDPCVGCDIVVRRHLPRDRSAPHQRGISAGASRGA
jgi:coenzyme F420-reducing hydrogenase alpha subunit